MKPLRYLLGLALVWILSSCAVQKAMTPSNITPDSRFRFAAQPGHPVAGYTTMDGSYQRFESDAWIEGDSMVFHRPETQSRMGAMEPTTWRRVALSDLASVDGIVISKAQTAGFAVVLTALATAVVYVVVSGGGNTSLGFGW
jgi:hypothetical protein